LLRLKTNESNERVRIETILNSFNWFNFEIVKFYLSPNCGIYPHRSCLVYFYESLIMIKS
jgi:hypothetical protein